MTIYSITLWTLATGSGFAYLSTLDFSSLWSFWKCQEYLPLSLSWGNSSLADWWFNHLQEPLPDAVSHHLVNYMKYIPHVGRRPDLNFRLCFCFALILWGAFFLWYYFTILSNNQINSWQHVCVKLKLFVWGRENFSFFLFFSFAVHLSCHKKLHYFLL